MDRKEYQKQWRAQHREELQLYGKRYRKENAEKVAEDKRNCYFKKRDQYRQRQKRYQQSHLKEIGEYQSQYKIDNPDRVKEWSKRTRQNNQEYIKAYRKKYESRPDVKIKKRYKLAIWSVLKGRKPGKKLPQLVGCSVDEFKRHLESTTPAGFSWDRYGSVYQVDHIMPCCSFNLLDPEQVKKCYHFTNLRILTAFENMKKNKKIPSKE